MRDLKVTGVDGADLQLVDDEGGRYRLSVDDRVRESVTAATVAAPTTEAESSRGNAPRAEGTQPGTGRSAAPAPATAARAVSLVPDQPTAPIGDLPHLPPGELVTPRAVQELLRAGHSVGHVAAAAGWDQAKVERYAAPIEAERSYIAGLAQDLPVGASTTDTAATVGQRVAARLHDRGVAGDTVAWDAHRTAGRGWVVVCRFSAGGRTREATWLFRAATRSLNAVDDEARWLGEDERAAGGPIPAPVAPVKVFDVEAEGGVSEPGAPSGSPASASASTSAGSSASAASATSAGAVDLVSAMQARSRGRRTRGSRNRSGRTPVDVPPIESLSDGSQATRSTHPEPRSVPVQQPGQTGHEADRADRAAPDETPAAPTVDDLGHDPVTGTVDLFGAVALRPDESGSASGLGDEDSAVADAERPQTAAPVPGPDHLEATAPTTDPEHSRHSEHTHDTAESERGEDAGALEDAEDVRHLPDASIGHGATAVDALHDSDRAAPGAPDPASETSGATPDRDDQAPGDQAEEPTVDVPSDETPSAAPPRRPSSARSGRPSVPSWDDIMFGGRRGRD
ncbi:septation protein SepH [Allobranchiibius sp. GilTou38]|uniref:septation protein SepH n=1 Tax=Allobranchiibius sp. GilTou38 TaxID=2815210 RepID=UPI001AA165CF|nr:septation protein SepH [Allobranchiibius sp. GilTou38]MBO1766836.1 DUF3071 domain-containing protein [Allobranchiibius sp. GilTou38]